MKIDGFDLDEGQLIRANIESGSTLPTTDLRVGRIFILTSPIDETKQPGLYCYVDSEWKPTILSNNDNTLPKELIDGLGDLAYVQTIDNNIWSGDELTVVNGGTESSTAEGARTALGIQESGTLDVGTGPGTVAAGNHTHEDIAINPTIIQTAHGFTSGTPIYFTGTSWLLAQADTAQTLATHIARVIDENTFTAVRVGRVVLSGLTPGAWYYVSTTEPGELTAADPMDGYSNIVGRSLDATTLMVMVTRALAIPEVEPYDGDFLRFDGNDVFTLRTVNNSSTGWDGIVEYSPNGVNWVTWQGQPITCGRTYKALYLRGVGNTTISTSVGTRFVFEGAANEVTANGNIMTLLDWSKVSNNETVSMGDKAFHSLFYGCTTLVLPPELPAMTVSVNGYDAMFQGCTSLIAPPGLPATTVGPHCYRNMFRGCSSLEVSAYPFDGAYPWRIPTEGEGSTADFWVTDMLVGTGGDYTSNPSANTFYWLVEPPVPATLPISEPPVPLEGHFVSFVGNTTFSLGVDTVGWDGTMEYSYDADSWDSWDGSTIDSGNNRVIYVRGSGNTIVSTSISTRFVFEGAATQISANGNIMTLLDWETVEDDGTIVLGSAWFGYMFDGATRLVTAPELPATTLTTGCYNNMFRGCTSLLEPPALPATTLATRCYSQMFRGCTSLTTPPVLPATTLADYCYQQMFQECTALTSAPELPATTLADYCYQHMFRECTSLTTPPVLPATTLADYCYSQMFQGCTSLTTPPVLPATTLADYCYQQMFQECTTLTAAPELPATTLATRCYSQMFRDCTALTAALELPATTLANFCYLQMFYGCTSLVSPPVLPATTLADNCYQSMFRDCTALTAAPELPATTLADYCYQYMFYGCTALTAAPELPAIALANYCYSRMFQECTALTSAPELPATTLADYCYQQMFQGCTALTAAPELPATTLATRCYSQMFEECTSLTTPPVLPATTLANNCYRNMFQGCTTLTAAPVLPATTLADYCYRQMFYGCTALTAAPELPATTLANSCYYQMFQGCTTLTAAPELPAIALANYCYYQMFYGCTSLVSPPGLPATTLANGCYYSMFQGCTALKVSATPTVGAYPWRFPTSGTAAAVSAWNTDMLTSTGGSFTGTPAINTIYWIESPPVPPTEPYSEEEVLPYDGDFVRFDGDDTFSLRTSNNTKNWIGVLEYSSNGVNWSTWLGATISCGEEYNSLYLRGTGNTAVSTSTATYFVFSGSATQISANGNIMTLLDWEKVRDEEAVTMGDTAFRSLFYQATKLIEAPEMPATTLTIDCYYQMFYGCTALTAAPELPATTLANNCYQYMFHGCTALTAAPELPATTLANSCYYQMFYGCTALTAAPELPATALTTNCYRGMFQGCTSLISPPGLPATTLANGCYYSMFQGCTALKVSATPTVGAYPWRFPTSGTAAAVSTWNTNMLTSTGGSFTGTPAINTIYWIESPPVPPTEPEPEPAPPVPLEGDFLSFVGNDDFTLQAPKGWNGTIEYSHDADNWTTWTGSLISSGVGQIIYVRGTGNITVSTNLTTRWVIGGSASEVFVRGNIMTLLDWSKVANDETVSMGNNAFFGLFYLNPKLVTAPELPATTLANNCYRQMFQGCTSLISPPGLPATTLADGCYRSMFQGCTTLKVSATPTVGAYPWRFPTSGTAEAASNWSIGMLTSTGGSFTGTPAIDTTYWIESPPVPPTEPYEE